jgi:tRNA(adenine34) deaminase
MAVCDNQYWMKFALQEAEKALKEDEIPVGAALIKDGKLILSNHNRTRQNNDPTAHAEKLIIQEIIKKREKVLYEYTLYVTLEPCTMCAGMLVLAKLGKLVYGTKDPKTGAVGSLYNIPEDKQLNHNIEVISGILSEECGNLLRKFFQSKR